MKTITLDYEIYERELREAEERGEKKKYQYIVNRFYDIKNFDIKVETARGARMDNIDKMYKYFYDEFSELLELVEIKK